MNKLKNMYKYINIICQVIRSAVEKKKVRGLERSVSSLNLLYQSHDSGSSWFGQIHFHQRAFALTYVCLTSSFIPNLCSSDTFWMRQTLTSLLKIATWCHILSPTLLNLLYLVTPLPTFSLLLMLCSLPFLSLPLTCQCSSEVHLWSSQHNSVFNLSPWFQSN